MTKNLLFFILFYLIAGMNAYSQDKINILKLEKEANNYFKSGKWHIALPLFEQLDSLEPSNPEYNYKLGICYYNSVDKAKSLEHFQEAKNARFELPELDFFLARAYHFNNLFDTAKIYYKKYKKTLDKGDEEQKGILEEVNRYIRNCNIGKRLLPNSLELKIENVGPNINSRYADYVPVISADESTLLFTSRRESNTGGKITSEGRYYEDIYVSHKDDNGEWDTPEKLKPPINTKYHDACIGMSKDGSVLLLYKSNNGGDIYTSELKNGEWSRPEPIPGPVNTPHWESSASFSTDMQYLYFTSDKPGGFGGSDIYIAKKQADGNWGEPVNLGLALNTPYDEDAPLIHSDGKTLFFSSKGHEGIGGYDIFSSTYDSLNRTWSKPKNIGYPVNTADDDIYFSLTSDGSKGYFTSFRNDTYGEKDIYVMHRPLSSSAMFLFKGRIFNQTTDEPLPASITLTDIQSQKVDTIVSADLYTGKYSFNMEFDKDYNLTVDAKGYIFHSENINISKQADLFEYVMNFTTRNEYIVSLESGVDVPGKIANIDAPDINYPANSNGKIGKADKGKISKTGETKNNKASKKDKAPPSATNLAGANETRGLTDTKNRDDTAASNISSDDVEFNDKKEAAVAERNRLLQIQPETSGKTAEDIVMSYEDPAVNVRHLNLIRVGKKVILKNILFDFNKATLRPGSRIELNNLYNMMAKNDDLHIEISGHTDNVGRKRYNQKLSESRAKAVYDYLVRRGIDKNRLVKVGYGESRPLVSNETVSGRRINRRTEFEIIARTNDQLSNKLASDNTLKSSTPSNYITWNALPVKAHFQYNDSKVLTDYSKERLQFLIDILSRERDMKIAIVGYEDFELEDAGKKLSTERAKTVYNYLAKQGINKNRMEIKPYNEISEFVAFEKEKKGINRRKVEFYYLD